MFKKVIMSGMLLLTALSLSADARDIKPESGKVEGKKTWFDCKKLDLEGKGWTNTKAYYDRLPAKAEGVVRGPVWGLSHNTSGMLYRFKTNSKTFSVRWSVLSKKLAMSHMSAKGVSGVDLYARTKGGKWRYVRSKNIAMSIDNQMDMYIRQFDEFMLYLPLYNGITKIEIGLDNGSTLSTLEETRKQVVFYGSSITQGACASRAGMSYTAMVGRKDDVEVINLGFSGNGKMEPELSDLLCELSPDMFVLDCLWNISADMAKELYEPFVRKLAAKYPNKPILIAEDCNVAGISPTDKGKVANAVYKKLKAEGIGNLHYISNKGMQGDDGEATVDGTHPNDLGMMRMANVFAPKVAEILELKLK